MPNMLERAVMLSDSARLRTASSWLKRIAIGGCPDDKGQEALRWAGKYLTAVGPQHAPKSAIGGNLAANAVLVRPLYYNALANASIKFPEVGLRKQKDVENFFARFLGILKSGGNCKTKSNLPPRQLNFAAELLQEVAIRLLTDRDRDRRPATPEI